ncbi:MAG: FimV/HubP family polar landmark protein [Pseudomonadales bacterium]
MQSARALAAGILLGAASSSWSLGLGEIELDSALNEKLAAEIELLDAQGLQPTELIVSLASAEDFARVGVERFFFLTDLRFEVAFGPAGVRNIRVFSTQPVTEPYLNFLVEVLWPNGRLLKEYTLLLDPPTFSPAAAPPVSAPSQGRDVDSGAGQVQRPRAAGTTAAPGTRVQLDAPRQRQSSPLDQGVVDGEYRMTDRDDTLWAIAAETRPAESVSVQQNMLAIQRLNPDAFLKDNINLVKAGYSLRLPSESEALSVSNADAGRLVAMQNEDWRALRAGEPVPARDGAEQRRVAQADDAGSDLRAPVDATRAPERAAAPAQGRDGELRIVAGAGDSVAGGTDPETAEQLNAAREEQDRLSREIADLNQALTQEKELASNQIAVKDRQLEVRDQQIAEMQAQLERMRQEMQQAQANPAQSQNQSASGSQAWWQSPYVLGGAAGVVVLLLVYGLISARRRRASEEFYPEDEVDVSFADESEPAPQQMRREPAIAAATAVSATQPAEDGDEAAVEDHDDEVAATGSETGDVIGEADIYIAYGRYPQAIGLLLGVLEDDADRNDVRLKLLELYAETRDREAFDTHMAELVQRCDDDEALLTARELSQQFGGDEPAAADTVDLDAQLDVDTDETDDVVDVDGPPTAYQATANEVADSAEDALDDPDFEATPAAAAGPDQTEEFELELDDLAGADSAADSLGGDLGMDFDPDRDRNGEAAAADDLDLDLDLDDADTLADDAFDFEDDGDTASTKLDLARAYIDMGDQDGARDILTEVVSEGNADQQQRAQAMLEELSAV